MCKQKFNYIQVINILIFLGGVEVKNEIVNVEGGFVVKPVWSDIKRVEDLIRNFLRDSDVSVLDFLTALCISSVEIAYHAGIEKPQYLSKVSNLWELLDRHISEKSE